MPQPLSTRTKIGLACFLTALGAGLFFTRVDGVFTVDEDSYLVTVLGLRAGSLTVPGTGGLPPSRELVYFDPTARSRVVDRAPAASTAPPLYAFFALPFSLFGWRGLVLLNVLSLLGAALIVFGVVRRHAATVGTPWLAMAAFALGAYNLEYGQGVWPHMLAVFLCTAAFALAGRARETGALMAAAAAGFLAALAAGVRYQNAFLAACLGLGLLLLAQRRWHVSAAFAAGACLPLLACSFINHARLGSWNPVTKGGGYLSLEGAHLDSNPVLGALSTFWAKVVDMSAHPAFPPRVAAENAWASRGAVTGAFLAVPGVVKKSLLQSAPWTALALVVMVLAVARWRRHTPAARETLLAAVVALPVIGLFAGAGPLRHDGLCYNQRYFLELVPLLVVALALAVDGLPGRWLALLLGLLAAVVLGAFVLPLSSALVGKQRVVLEAPLAMAVVLLGGWGVWRRKRQGTLLAVGLGLCLGWGASVHLLDDVPADWEVRLRHQLAADALGRGLPGGPTALFACDERKMAPGIRQLEHDLVILDGCADEGAAAAPTAEALLAQGRRVLVLLNGYREGPLARLTASFAASSRSLPIAPGFEDLTLVELRLRDAAGHAP